MTFDRELREALAAAAKAGEYVASEYVRFTPIPNAPATSRSSVTAAVSSGRLLRSSGGIAKLRARSRAAALGISGSSKPSWMASCTPARAARKRR